MVESDLEFGKFVVYVSWAREIERFTVANVNVLRDIP